MKYIITFLIAMTPILELRGAIPYAVSQGIGYPLNFIIALAGNIIIIPILLYLIEPLFNWIKGLKGLAPVKNFVQRYEERAMRKMRHYDQLKILGLFVLVAIPLPGTGAYTGCVAAAILRVRKRDAFVAIALGVLVAGILVLGATYSFKQLF